MCEGLCADTSLENLHIMGSSGNTHLITLVRERVAHLHHMLNHRPIHRDSGVLRRLFHCLPLPHLLPPLTHSFPVCVSATAARRSPLCPKRRAAAAGFYHSSLSRHTLPSRPRVTTAGRATWHRRRCQGLSPGTRQAFGELQSGVRRHPASSGALRRPQARQQYACGTSEPPARLAAAGDGSFRR